MDTKQQQTGWPTCVGRPHMIEGKPCAICGHMTHERSVTGEGNALRYIYNRDGKVIDTDSHLIVSEFDNWIDARGECDSLNGCKS